MRSTLFPILLAVAALAGCVTETATPANARQSATVSSKGPIVIRDDDGGNVTGYVMRRDELANSGRRVEFRGYCASACTLLMTIPNACVAPDALIGFHAPHFIASGKPAPIMNQLMARYYRAGVLNRWNAVWSRSTKMQTISGREYHRLDPQMKLCR